MSSSPADAGPRDGTWRELAPPDVRGARLSFVDPADGKLTVLTGYSGRALKQFDLAGNGGWSVESIIGGSPSMNVSLGVVPDFARRRLIAVGMDFEGYETGVFGEVELWSLPLDAPRQWGRIATTGTGPTERFAANLALDRATSTLYVVGGVVDRMDSTSYVRTDLGDTWRIDLDGDLRWEPFPLVGEPLPGALFGGAFFDAASQRLVLVAAWDTLGGPLDHRRVRALDVAGTRAWSELPPVPDELPRYNAALGVLDPVDHRFLALSNREVDDMAAVSLWALDPAGAGSWSRTDLPPDMGTPVVDPALVTLDPEMHRLVYFGGFERGGSLGLPNVEHTDVWLGTLDGGLSWKRAYESVSGRGVRWFLPVVLDEQRRRAVAVSPYNRALFCYALDAPQAWTAVATEGPGMNLDRSGALCLFDPPGDRLIVHGGGAELEYADLWELSFAFSPPRWRRLVDAANAPSARRDAAATYDPLRRRMVMFGGSEAGRALDDTWELDLRLADPTWRRIEARGIPPVARWGHRAAYDSRRDGMIVYGGLSDPGVPAAALQDAWFLSFRDGDTWVPLRSDNAAPSARVAPATFYDPVEDRLVVVGGSNDGGPRFDTHALELAGGTPHWSDYLPQGLVPPASTGGSALYEASTDRVYLFGQTGTVGGVVSVLEWDRVPGAPPAGSQSGPVLRILGVGPNPSRGDVNIAFELRRTATVEARLYDVRGRLVRDFGRTTRAPGPHLLSWDGRDQSGDRLRDGVYFAKVVVEGEAISGKIVLMD